MTAIYPCPCVIRAWGRGYDIAIDAGYVNVIVQKYDVTCIVDIVRCKAIPQPLTS